MGWEQDVFGAHERTLDEKGRVVLPPTFRRVLDGTAFLVRLDGCLGLWNRQQFDAAAERVRDSVRMGVAHKNAMRAFFGRVFEAAVDGQGRLLLPADLRLEAGLERDITVAGLKEHIEIWDAERWRAMAAEAEESTDFTDVVMGLGMTL
jgi:MraZ protein